MVICCYLDDNLDELIAKWKAEAGVPSPDKLVIVLKIKNRRLPQVLGPGRIYRPQGGR